MKSYELKADNSLLLIIDIQEKLVPAMDHGPQVIEKAKILLETAGHLGIPLVVTEQYTKGLGQTAAELAPWLARAGQYEKMTFSGCTEPVMEHLRSTGRRQIIVTGMETHVCVFQTVRGLIEQGYDVHVVQDGVCSRTKANYRNALDLMREMGAVITNTETVFFDLLKEAGTESFRQLRKLIK